MLRCEQNNHYQPVIIAFDVEDVVFVSHIIHRIEGFSYISKVMPFRSFCFLYPILQCNPRLRITFDVFVDSRFSNDSHIQIIQVAKIQKFRIL